MKKYSLATVFAVVLTLATVQSGAENENLTVEDVHVLNVTDSSVEFLVRASKSVQNLTVKYFEKLDNKSVTTLELANGDGILIEGLIPSGLYTFQFQVATSDGDSSDWSNPMEVVLLPYTPEMMIQGQSLNMLKIKWSRNFNDFSRETIDGYMLSYGSLTRNKDGSWSPISCMINIQLPNSCNDTSHTITESFGYNFYEIHLKAHTEAGYGKPAVAKVGWVMGNFAFVVQ